MATDEELYRVFYDAMRDDNRGQHGAAGRRALYEAGYHKGLRDARAGYRLVRRDRVDWLLTNEARTAILWLFPALNRDEVKSLLKALHDRITGGGQ